MSKELQFLIYNTPQENIKVDVVVKDETIWLTQKAMATLFGTSRENITMHLKSVFEDAELEEVSVCKKFLLTAAARNRYSPFGTDCSRLFRFSTEKLINS